MSYPPPLSAKNTIIFESNHAARRHAKSLSAHHYLTDVARNCPHGVCEAVVEKVEFRKSSEKPNHEFLLCYVKDCNVSNRKAVIRIERWGDSTHPHTPDEEPADNSSPRRSAFDEALRVSASSIQSSSASLYGTAYDRFTISCDCANVKRSDHTLSTLIFGDASFTADQAAMISRIASDCADKYNAITHQCYWYARVIYNVIQETQSGHFKKMPPEDDKRMGLWRGTMKLVNNDASNIFIDPSHQSDQLTKTYDKEWPEWIEHIRKRKLEVDEPRLEIERGKLEIERGHLEREELQQQLSKERKEKAELEMKLQSMCQASSSRQTTDSPRY